MTAIDFAAFVDELATVSGETILPFFRTSLGVHNKSLSGSFDPVTAADRAAEAAMRTLIRRMLMRGKITNLMEAENGQDALRRLRTAAIDLVICDWNMSDISGMELFGMVRAFKPKLPFLMVTGRNDPSSALAAKEAGVAGYMVKPISQEELKNTVVSLLATAARE